MLFPMRPAYECAGTQMASSQKFSGLNVSQQCMPADGAGRCSEAPGSEGAACCSAGVMGSSAVTGIAAATAASDTPSLRGGGPSSRWQPVRSSTPASATPGGSTQTHMQGACKHTYLQSCLDRVAAAEAERLLHHTMADSEQPRKRLKRQTRPTLGSFHADSGLTFIDSEGSAEGGSSSQGMRQRCSERERNSPSGSDSERVLSGGSPQGSGDRMEVDYCRSATQAVGSAWGGQSPSGHEAAAGPGALPANMSTAGAAALMQQQMLASLPGLGLPAAAAALNIAAAVQMQCLQQLLSVGPGAACRAHSSSSVSNTELLSNIRRTTRHQKRLQQLRQQHKQQQRAQKQHRQRQQQQQVQMLMANALIPGVVNNQAPSAVGQPALQVPATMPLLGALAEAQPPLLNPRQAVAAVGGGGHHGAVADAGVGAACPWLRNQAQRSLAAAQTAPLPVAVQVPAAGVWGTLGLALQQLQQQQQLLGGAVQVIPSAIAEHWMPVTNQPRSLSPVGSTNDS